MDRFHFPPWVDKFMPLVVLLSGGGVAYGLGLIYFATAPYTTDVGYEPQQPVPYSHRLHVGQLKMDCRYCHNTVEEAAHAAVPPTKTCVNCHSPKDATGQVATTAIHADSPKLEPVRESWAEDMPVLWNRVHDLPDYVYFNHSAHVRRGVSCVSCHGRVDEMEVVYQVEPLSMGWCLQCHRNPEPHLRPLDEVTNLGWVPEYETLAGESDAEAIARAKELIGAEIRQELGINPHTNCSTCHR